MANATASQKGVSNQEAIKALHQLAEKWPSTVVVRSEFDKFSGGAAAPSTLANHDSEGTGIHGAFRISRKIAYPVDSAIEWLIAKLEVV